MKLEPISSNQSGQSLFAVVALMGASMIIVSAINQTVVATRKIEKTNMIQDELNDLKVNLQKIIQDTNLCTIMFKGNAVNPTNQTGINALQLPNSGINPEQGVYSQLKANTWIGSSLQIESIYLTNVKNYLGGTNTYRDSLNQIVYPIYAELRLSLINQAVLDGQAFGSKNPEVSPASAPLYVPFLVSGGLITKCLPYTIPIAPATGIGGAFSNPGWTNASDPTQCATKTAPAGSTTNLDIDCSATTPPLPGAYVSKIVYTTTTLGAQSISSTLITSYTCCRVLPY